MTTRNPHDLAHIRPVAELDRAQVTHGFPSGGPVKGQRRRRKGRRARKEWSLPAKLIAIAGLVVLLAAAGLGGVFYVVDPSKLVREELVRQVRANTGRELLIRGATRFSFYPSIAVSLGDVALSDGSNQPAFSAQNVDVSVALLPLLSERVRIQHIRMVRPVINLHIDETGRRNWDFQKAASIAPVQFAQLGSSVGGMQSRVDARLFHQAGLVFTAAPFGGLELGAISFSKAKVFYRDDRSGTTEQFDSMDLDVQGGRLTDPLTLNGDTLWRNQRLRVNGRIEAVANLFENKSTTVRATISSQSLSGGFDGTVKLNDALELKGQTRLESVSLVQAASWLGWQLPNAAPLGGFSLRGQLAANSKAVSLKDANVQLGTARATGELRMELGADRPALDAQLRVAGLDVDKLSAGFAEATLRPGGITGRRLGTGGKQAGPPTSIEDLLNRSKTRASGGAGRFAPQVRGYTSRNEWSDKPIQAEQLRLLDAKARLKFDGLRIAGLNAQRVIARVSLNDGVLTTDFEEIELYEGKGSAVIRVQPTRNGLGIGANVRVDQIEANRLLADAAGFDRLVGKGDFTAVISGSGVSQKAIAESINGTASIEFKDGAVIGWNLNKLVQLGQLPDLKARATERTEFSRLAASFKINQGVASTADLRLVSPVLEVSGQGDVRIGSRSLDLALQPQLIAAWGQQTGLSETTKLEIPVKLKGPWDGPRIVLDTDQYKKDPSKLIDQAKEIGRRFKGKDIGDIVRGVLGQDDGTSNKPKDILNNLLRR